MRPRVPVALVEHGVDLRADGHVHRQGLGARADLARGLHPLDRLADTGTGRLQVIALTQQAPQATVARLVVGAGEDQIAETGQPGQRARLGPDRLAQALHFGQTAGHQRGAGIAAVARAVGDPGRDREDVLQGPPHLHTDHVVIAIDAQSVAMQCAGQAVQAVFALRGRRQCGGLAAGHLCGEGGSGDQRGREAGAQFFLGDLVQPGPAGRLQSLGGPGDRLVFAQAGLHPAQRLAKGPGRDGEQHQLRVVDHALVGADGEILREGDARQIAGVFAFAIQPLGGLVLADPERDVLVQPRGVDRQRGTPGAATQECNAHGYESRLRPGRSTPARPPASRRTPSSGLPGVAGTAPRS